MVTEKELIRKAIEAMEYAYTPYSDFQVGAALLTEDGKIYQGCNIENAAYTPTVCAERTAFFKAVSEGEREFTAIAVVGGKKGIIRDYCPPCGYTAPCGVCRQVMREFCQPDVFRIILARDEEHWKEYVLSELLPEGFGPENLQSENPK